MYALLYSFMILGSLCQHDTLLPSGTIGSCCNSVKCCVKTRQTTDGAQTSPIPVVLVKRVRFDRYSTSPESVRALMKRISISLTDFTGFYRCKTLTK